MRWFTFAASFLAVLAFASTGMLQAHGGGGHGGGGHGGGGHGGGGHGGAHAGGARGGSEHGGGEHGRPTFAGGNGNGVNTALNGLNNTQNNGVRVLGGPGGLTNGAVINKLANGQTLLNGGSIAGLGGTSPLGGNPSGSIVRLANGGLNNGAGLGGLANGLNSQQGRNSDKQLLHKRLIEAHKLAQLAKQSGDPQLLAQAQQMAQQVQQQYAKEFGGLPNGLGNNPGIAIGPANQSLNNTSGGNGFFPPGNLAGGQGNNQQGNSKR